MLPDPESAFPVPVDLEAAEADFQEAVRIFWTAFDENEAACAIREMDRCRKILIEAGYSTVQIVELVEGA